MKKVIHKMKNSKAPRQNEIRIQMMKYGDFIIRKENKIVKRMRTKKKISQKWKTTT